MFTAESITEQLKNFNVPKGKIVTVHTSLKKVGEIEGGAETLLSALINCFATDGGLLSVPTHTWNSDIYDMNKAESCIGALPRVAAGHPDGIRTLHPTHSMKVFGEKKRVEEFTEDEAFADSPTPPGGCYGKIYREGGYVLLIGVGHDKNTYIHCVEEMLSVKNRLTDDKVEKRIILKDGSIQKRFLHWFDTRQIRDVSKFFGKFEPAFRHHECIVDGFVGNAPSQMCDAVKMKNVIELIYKNSGGKELLSDDTKLDESLYK